jgi:hypothetical protein
MKPLLKTPYRNLPLSILESWSDFFEQQASTLDVSRNGALKLGGPMVGK